MRKALVCSPVGLRKLDKSRGLSNNLFGEPRYKPGRTMTELSTVADCMQRPNHVDSEI